MSLFGNKNTIDFSIEKVMKALPHRYPFLLIDKVIAMNVDEKKITAIKNVTINEPFFQGHFPSKPIMPGVLIIEAMAQACGILAVESYIPKKENTLFFFLSIENAKFRIPVIPGDVLTFECFASKVKGPVSRFECSAFVEGKLVTEATLTAKIVD